MPQFGTISNTLVLNSGESVYYDGSAFAAYTPSGGGGITSLNTLSGSTQVFATGVAGTDFTISSSGTTHTFDIPDASASARGLVTTGAQTFAGAKTLTGLPIVTYVNSGTTLGGASGIPSQGLALINSNGGTSGNPFGILFGGTSGYHHSAIFGVQTYDVNNRSGDIVFASRPQSGDSSLTESLRITSNGAFHLGRPPSSLTAAGRIWLNTRDTASLSNLVSTGSVNVVGEGNVAANAGSALVLYGPFSGSSWTAAGGVKAAKSNATDGEYGFDLTFHTRVNGGNSTEKMRITTDGALAFLNDTFTQRNSTNAQTLNISNTYTSSTNFEYGRFQWNTNEFRIGTAVGSAGGTGRSTVFGNWNTAGTWLPLITVSGGGSRTVTHTARVNGVGSADVVFSADSSNVGAGFTLLNNNGTVWNVFSAGSSTSYNDNFSLLCNNAYRLVISTTGNQQWLQGASTTGSPTLLTVTGAAHTTLTASTEATDVNFNLARTVQFAAGAITTQRAFRIQAPTYAFASASTITTASTLAISGAPAAGTNATITNAHALLIDNATNSNSIVRINAASSGGNPTQYSTWNASASFVAYLDNSSDNPAFGVLSVGGSYTKVAVGLNSGEPFIGFGSGSSGRDVFITRDAANTLAVRNSTNAQTFNIANTYTSSTSFEYGRFQWASNEFRIGTAVGSAGGTQRNLVLGAWDSAGTWTAGPTVLPTGNLHITQSKKVGLLVSTTGSVLTFNNGNLVIGNLNSSVEATFTFSTTGGSGTGLSLTPVANSGISATHFSVTTPADTAMPASVESTAISFNCSATRTFAAGALTTQREFRIQSPTYAFASASTITNAATFSIGGAPAAGANATLTNSFALWVETGASQFGGSINTLSTVVLNTGSQGSTTGFHWLSWNNGAIGWISTGTVSAGSTPETAFYRGAANYVDLRSGTTATSFAVYNTYTSSTSYERGVLDWKTTANTLRIGTEKGSGGGLATNMVFVTDATDRLTVTSTGTIHAVRTIGQTNEVANTPSGTTQTITLDSGNHQILNLGSSTGAVTVTLTIPSKSGAGSVLVKQHGTIARNITWNASAGSVVWLGTQPTWSSDGVGKFRRVSWYYSPTESTIFLAASDSN